MQNLTHASMRASHRNDPRGIAMPFDDDVDLACQTAGRAAGLLHPAVPFALAAYWCERAIEDLTSRILTSGSSFKGMNKITDSTNSRMSAQCRPWSPFLVGTSLSIRAHWSLTSSRRTKIAALSSDHASVFARRGKLLLDRA